MSARVKLSALAVCFLVLLCASILFEIREAGNMRLPRNLWTCTLPDFPAGASPYATGQTLIDASCARYERAIPKGPNNG